MKIEKVYNPSPVETAVDLSTPKLEAALAIDRITFLQSKINNCDGERPCKPVYWFDTIERCDLCGKLY